MIFCNSKKQVTWWEATCLQLVKVKLDWLQSFSKRLVKGFQCFNQSAKQEIILQKLSLFMKEFLLQICELLHESLL